MAVVKLTWAALRTLGSRLATSRAAKAAFFFILLCPFLFLSVSADTFTFNINNYSYVDTSSVFVQTSPAQYDFQFINGYLDSAFPTDVFTFDSNMFRFRFVAQDIGASEYPNIIRFQPTATFNLPIPQDHFDETSIVFSIVTGLYTNQDKQLLLNIIDDVVIIINGNTITPISSSKKDNGTYWTYEVSFSDLEDETSLTILPLFQDYSSVADPTYGNFPSDVWWMVQFSEIIFSGSQSASAKYAAAINTLLENDISPTLDNIESLMDSMSEQQAATNSQLAELPDQIGDEMHSALQSEADREYNQGLSEGDSQVQGALGSFPTDSISSADNALQLFANALGSNSRECVLQMPSIIVPELRDSNGNVFLQRTELSPAYDVDFAYYWNEVIPPPIVLVIRAFVTLCLCVYVFKEMFTFISMFKG